MGCATAAPAKAPEPAKAYDFNGDGNRDYTNYRDQKGVIVTYGTKSGPGTETFAFDQDSPGIPGKNKYDEDSFGASMASADFNGDGYADLAASDAGESADGHYERGMVVIVWGSKSGLGSKASTIDPTSSDSGQFFGIGLAAGDFNGDGKPDLAVTDDRAVHVHRGGFTPSGTTGKVSTATPPKGSEFGPISLVAGNVTKDRNTDLYALGYKWADGRYTSGIWFLKGGSTIKPGKLTMADKPTRSYDLDEAVLADFDKDGYGDLAYNDTRYKKYAGSVRVLRGGANGPTSSYRLTQDTPGVATAATAGDFFGGSISAGDTNRDGYPDLAIGTGEELGDLDGAGGAHVLHGGKKGLTGTGSKWFTRDTKGIPGKAKEYEGFGAHVRLDDFDRDGDADLLLSGAPVKDKPSGTLLNGGRSGITTATLREVPFTATYYRQ
ncbi:integrin-like protein [Streptomyces katsurahamanus]|uniref:Integrin-like protein n=2 Tax=Streptomyces katsurahamanus TaxID=2577098 RepID=A0ABW9NQ55_9ACTN|nr:integrin-like protein [Streptomyces katsurahamanus]